jgi:energy-coupling factor transporter ATP-binding protein EcfA2
MTHNSGNQPNWWDPVQQFLDSKLINWGLPGIFVALAADHAKHLRWKEFGIFLAIAAAVWLGLQVGGRLLPYFDKLLDWLFRHLEEGVADLTDSTEGKYYRRLKADCEDYEGRGFNAGGLSLEAVYVPLKVSERFVQDISQNIVRQPPTLTLQSLQNIGELLLAISQPRSRCRRLVILGAPGSGKSTLMRHITLMYASRKRRRLHRQLPKLHPVLLRLRDVYETILESPENSLADLITQAVGQLSKELQTNLDSNPQWFEKRLRSGHCLVMIDGFDEIADDQQRQQVRHWIDQQLRDYFQTPFILTSRPEAYQKTALHENAIDLEVQPFTTEERDNFIYNWCINWRKSTTTGKVNVDKAAHQAQEMIQQINGVPTLRLMATNPLLLSLMARTHLDKGKLANKRVNLYAEVCQVLLEGRQRYQLPETSRLSAGRKQDILQRLALAMTQAEVLQFTLHETPQEDGIYPQARDLLQAELSRVPKAGPSPEAFITQDEIGVRELLSARQREGLYEFAHRTFQEYLAAAEIKKTGQLDCLLNAFRTGEQALAWWRETIRFYAEQADATQIIQAALETPNIAALTLAYECFRATENLDPVVQQALEQRLERGLESGNAEAFRLAATVQLRVRLNRLNADLLGMASGDHEPPDIVDTQDVTWAEFQLFREQVLLTEVAPRAEAEVVHSGDLAFGGALEAVTGITVWQGYQFCGWLSRMTAQQFGAEGICYRLLRPESPADPASQPLFPGVPRLRLVRFRVAKRYQRLAHLLAMGQWQLADQETLKVMLQVTGKANRSYLLEEDLLQFPCNDLRLLDFLWQTYSYGRFGFTVQQQLYRHSGATGQPSAGKRIWQQFDLWEQFGDRVGWRVDGVWKPYQDLTFEATAPVGHLPVPFVNAELYRWRVDQRSSEQGRRRAIAIAAISTRLAHCETIAVPPPASENYPG